MSPRRGDPALPYVASLRGSPPPPGERGPWETGARQGWGRQERVPVPTSVWPNNASVSEGRIPGVTLELLTKFFVMERYCVKTVDLMVTT